MISKSISRISLIFAFAPLMLGAPAHAQAAKELPKLSLEQKTSLRCAAAFAIVAHGQSIGNEDALKWPAMDKRGREYFVRVSAGIMDAAKIDRQTVAAMMERDAQALWDAGEVQAIMPSCLLMLEASGI